MTGVAALASLLVYAILTLWIEERWAWSAFQAGVFLTGAGLALQAFFRPVRWERCAALAPLAAAALWPLLQLAAGRSIARWETWNAVLNWGVFLTTFAISLQTLTDSRTRRWFLHGLSGFALVFSVVATAQSFSSGGKFFWLFPSGYTDAVMGPFVNRNQYAAFIELLLPVSLYLALTVRRFRVLHAAAAAAALVSVIACASRTGSALVLLEALAVTAAVAWRRMAPRRLLTAAAAQFALFAGLGIGIAGWQTLWTRLQTPDPQVMRQEMLRASLDMVRDHPVMGTGLGTWSTAYPAYASFDSGEFVNQAHDDWAQWAAEGGLPFLFFMAAFAALLCKPALQSIWGMGLLAFLLHCFVDYPMQQRPALAAWFFAIAGAAAAWQNARNRAL